MTSQHAALALSGRFSLGTLAIFTLSGGTAGIMPGLVGLSHHHRSAEIGMHIRRELRIEIFRFGVTNLSANGYRNPQPKYEGGDNPNSRLPEAPRIVNRVGVPLRNAMYGTLA